MALRPPEMDPPQENRPFLRRRQMFRRQPAAPGVNEGRVGRPPEGVGTFAAGALQGKLGGAYRPKPDFPGAAGEFAVAGTKLPGGIRPPMRVGPSPVGGPVGEPAWRQFGPGTIDSVRGSLSRLAGGGGVAQPAPPESGGLWEGRPTPPVGEPPERAQFDAAASGFGAETLKAIRPPGGPGEDDGWMRPRY